jgi:xylan 1,4-beta-xylosidase
MRWLSLCAFLVSWSCARADAPTWTPDNGNGTYTNPLFYDEFSDPDLIRVGDDFYLTGTTMHSMPGLPVLKSRDLVNWTFVAYAAEKLDLGPAFRLEGGKNIYGQGFWAPSFRYHDGTFYIFSNVNRETTQFFTATDPAGPWKHHEMKRSLHDLSVLFDGGKAFAIWGYRSIQFAQLTDDLTDIVPGTQREIIAKEAGMGEGLHFYKIDGKYFITSAWYENVMRMPAARAERPEGPYEVNQAISIDEDFGLAPGNRLVDPRQVKPPFAVRPGDARVRGRMSLHQGGLVQTPLGEWWGFSMMDFNSVGRLTALSPISWKDGWPYFGLPGNLGRTPRTWVKPRTRDPQPITVPYERGDDFSAATLKPVWQWNHVPVPDGWSLGERPGYLTLHALPATDLWNARNTLTQRSIGPKSSPETLLDASAMMDGDVAGLALFNRPYASIGVEKTAANLDVVLYDEQTGHSARHALNAARVWLRADCDFVTEQARFSYSTDGQHFETIGEPFTMAFQLTTFQGVRYALFSYHAGEKSGGAAQFDSFDVKQPYPHGLMRPIPHGHGHLTATGDAGMGVAIDGSRPAVGTPVPLEIVDMSLGRVAFKWRKRFLSIDARGEATFTRARPGEGESFQWMETPDGALVLLSLASHRYLRLDARSHQIDATSPGPLPDGSDGVRLAWRAAQQP